MSGKTAEFIVDLMTAVSNCALYSRDHPAARFHAEKAVSALEDLFAGDAFSIAVIGGSLIVNDQPFGQAGLHAQNLIKRFRRMRIDKVMFLQGVTAEEFLDFVADLATKDSISAICPHIMTGSVGVMMKSDVLQTDVLGEEMDKFKGIYQGVARFRSLDMVGLEEVVIGFVSAVKRETNILSLLSPVKAWSEYTYTHTTNVAILSIFQSEALGLRSEILYDIGLAGLLHDVGKLFVSREIIEKQAKLDNREWDEMKRHPLYGAKYLATLPDIPKLAVIGSYEHHMKYDGSGYPSGKGNGKRQHVISQIIAIADFFDALRTERSYRRAMDLTVIIDMLRQGAGKDFSPVLVESFLSALGRVTSA